MTRYDADRARLRREQFLHGCVDARAPWTIFGALIGLMHEGQSVADVIAQPITRDRWLGVRGQETLYNGGHARTRVCRCLDEARLSTSVRNTSPMPGGGASRALPRGLLIRELRYR